MLKIFRKNPSKQTLQPKEKNKVKQIARSSIKKETFLKSKLVM